MEAQKYISVDAEQAVLGSILCDTKAFVHLDKLKPEHFGVQLHENLYRIFQNLHNKTGSVDLVQIMELCEKEKVFDTQNSARAYLKKLIDLGGIPQNILSYTKILTEKYKMRQISAKIYEEFLQDNGKNFDELADEFENFIRKLREDETAAEFVPISQTIDEILKNPFDSKKIYHTGFTELEKFLQIKAGNLIIIAGRPGMGKTTFMLNIAKNGAYANPGKVTAMFSLEMNREEIGRKILTAEAGENKFEIQQNLQNKTETDRLYTAVKKLQNLKFGTIEGGAITPQKIRAMMRKIKGLGCVVIDYLGLILSDNPKKIETEALRVAAITRELKILAKEFEVPVILGCQLNRSVESRVDKRPNLSDLRDSGSIEQDADAVLMLYRQSYYEPDFEPKELAEAIILKNRMGGCGTVPLWFNAENSTFVQVKYKEEN
jgi:replicative DNA helicase